MIDTVVDALVLDLLEWLAKRDRSYGEVMDAWRTSCPRLPIWEEANDRGLVKKEEVNGRCVVRISSSGCAVLAQRKPIRVSAPWCKWLPSAPPDHGDTEADDGNSDPAISADAFTQKGFRSEGSGSVAQSADRHYKTHFLK